jgi:hypothetical protein|tara:strand:- start:78 stop:320 length:243 start_codon:yes stop_codon:yes gene_type:complete
MRRAGPRNKLSLKNTKCSATEAHRDGAKGAIIAIERAALCKARQDESKGQEPSDELPTTDGAAGEPNRVVKPRAERRTAI